MHFIHHALPEISASEIDTSVRFLGHTVSLPLFISCMTGGSERGFKANKELARAAQRYNIPVGMGSIRILFEKPDLFEHFHLKALAPDVPVLANLGGVQIRDLDHDAIFEMLRRLEVQSLVVHLNPGQELFQPEGDRDFRGIREAIQRLCERSPVPVIVKETGFGIRPSTIRDLLNMGVAYVDSAGSGGTNWIAVESYRSPEEEGVAAKDFGSWGFQTALLLAVLNDLEHSGSRESGILASGGIRTGMDVAKALALGAELAGLALPFIRAVASDGEEGAANFIQRLKKVLETVMVLTGSRDIPALRNGKIWLDSDFAQSAEMLRRAEFMPSDFEAKWPAEAGMRE